ncbi:MAG TPA: transglutaminase-like cysteine peptidase [Stellaceae bacterium]|jgi:predicted transglutaminase-like cysteine proteinase|nr:transglutaminase-like cysteine peptidase [Stellaceae bacterium]
MTATQEQLDQLADVNTSVNALPYEAAIGAHEPNDWWTDEPVPGQSWVCRDYVLAKADRLRAAGWAPGLLSVVLCYVETGEYHAVLAVDDGDLEPLILDSRFSQIYRMDQPPAAYRWASRQIAGTTEFEPVA